jgi:hypothetical protein
MNSTRLLVWVLTVSLLVTGCDPGWNFNQCRTIGAITGEAHSLKPDYPTIESTLAGVVALLESRGWEHYPGGTSYHLPGGRFYYENFSFQPNFDCFAEMGRKSANFRFYEWEEAPGSGIFTATEEQRARVRALARDVEIYLRSRLPASYEIHLSLF